MEDDFLHIAARNVIANGHDEWLVLSTSERLAVALILNRPDWLAEMRYTIADALDRIGTTWAHAVPLVAQALRDEGAV